MTLHGLAYESNLLDDDGDALLLIDVQNDFHPGGSLAIPTADVDAEKTAKFIEEKGSGLSAIYMTLDTHQQYHIAHPGFWVNVKGQHPKPFTCISHEDVASKTWMPVHDTNSEWCLSYTKSLQQGGRFSLTIWPPHCLVGSHGHCVREVVQSALLAWEIKYNKSVHYVLKGNNSLTEHYSAIRAEVVIPEKEVDTGSNKGILDALSRHRRVLIGGQALSHCVNFTVRDLALEWNQSDLASLVILEDTSSSVPGFEKEGDKFLDDMKHLGLTISTTTTCLT